jgi:hypothetical protein
VFLNLDRRAEWIEQEQAVSLLPADVSAQDRADFKKRLDLYKKHIPFREK